MRITNKNITFEKTSVGIGYLAEQVEHIHPMVATLQPQVATDKHRIVEIDEASKITRKTTPPIYTLTHKRLIHAYKCDKEFFFY